MSRPTHCPPDDHLCHLLAGDLPALAEAEVADHLTGCAVCQRRLEEQAAAGDIDPELVRELSRDDRPPRGSAYWPALDKLKHDEATAATAALPNADTDDGPSVLSFLGPPLREGSIGQFAEFDVVRIVGRGGMGIVFEAIDRCLERRVAVKVLDPKFAKDDTARQRFIREARAAAAVTHENVVIIHSVDEHDDLPYLVMQFVAGESLQERLERSRPTIPEAVAIGRQVAAGLAAAHARGLIHRDVKPANILITHDECLHCSEEASHIALSSMHRVKLTDFGLARAAEDVKITQTGFVPGTPQYMSPEQARGEPLDARSDLFSLGGVLYALVTGKAPFQGSTPYLVLRQVTDEKPAPMQSLNRDVPDWLVAIIDRLLAKDPKDRIQTSADVANLLFEGEARLLFCPIHGIKPQSGLARVTRHGRSRWSTPALAVALSLGLLLGAGLASLGWLPASLTRSEGHPADHGAAKAKFNYVGNSGAVWSIGYTPDGKTLAMAIEDGTVRLWDTASESIRASLPGHKGAVWAVDIKRDGTAIATAGEDGKVGLWSLPDGTNLGSVRLEGSARSVQFTPDGKGVLVASRDGTVTVYDALTQDRRLTTAGHEGGARAAVMSADGSTIASTGGDQQIKIWDGVTGQLRLSIPVTTGPIYGLAFAPDNRSLASCGWDKTIRLWDANNRELLREFNGHTEDVWHVSFSADGRRMASASQDKMIKIWDVATGKELISIDAHVGVAHTVVFTPDGRNVAAGGRDGTVKVWPIP